MHPDSQHVSPNTSLHAESSGEPLFQPAYDPQKNRSTAPLELPGGYWFLFYQNNLLLQEGSKVVPQILPQDVSSKELQIQAPVPAPSNRSNVESNLGTLLNALDLSWALDRIQRIYYFGTLKGKPCWACSLTQNQPLGKDSNNPPPGWEAVNLRMAYGRLSSEELQAARFASHLLFWDRNTRFCGVCGAPTTDKPDERAKLCTQPNCGAVFYPKISPAVIVAILDGDRILLAHNRRFVSKFYSLIAGFVEIGESLEDCVHREVLEEVGVTVKNVRYFGSQPWPTPDSLMIGFLADYAGGSVRIQDDELHDARWFSPPDMPQLPPSDSIARKILRWYETEYVPKIRGQGH
ncbi:MAG: NAD(+) diphosphatase [Spirochaetes bacterium]|nr:NAD(+) diphosphatase [Spirochaetota bacterium]